MQSAVRGLQERTARALPPEHVEDAGGWWLRHAPSCAWWIGTVLPHGDAGPGELARRVAAAEEFYAGRGAVARFQISPGACPEGLDAFLAERGYLRQSPVSLQVAPTARVLERARAGSLRVRLADRPTRAWFESWHAVNGGDSRSEWDLLGRVERPAAYATAMIGGDVVAVGRAVADTGWVGVFGMATLPEARGRGAARTVLAALARWADAHRAEHMYLQVERDNLAAIRLYERMGFGEICGYHYRIPDPAARA
ncbi:GNAT family N-acetyltransferase [Nonomuraea sp. LPB2021202275-12-8]|uniref:GNAT family N-acetyltransferase n=1 Tax=Nonomuraea sp. LPB2021202275-12-8 TaxID=3120159 RepID=UPI003FA569C0